MFASPSATLAHTGIAWAHFAATPARWQDIFAGEDADPLSIR
jgi:hypothetical protein